jgi:hypothetical protein
MTRRLGLGSWEVAAPIKSRYVTSEVSVAQTQLNVWNVTYAACSSNYRYEQVRTDTRAT